MADGIQMRCPGDLETVRELGENLIDWRALEYNNIIAEGDFPAKNDALGDNSIFSVMKYSPRPQELHQHLPPLQAQPPSMAQSTLHTEASLPPMLRYPVYLESLQPSADLNTGIAPSVRRTRAREQFPASADELTQMKKANCHQEQAVKAEGMGEVTNAEQGASGGVLEDARREHLEQKFPQWEREALGTFRKISFKNLLATGCPKVSPCQLEEAWQGIVGTAYQDVELPAKIQNKVSIFF